MLRKFATLMCSFFYVFLHSEDLVSHVNQRNVVLCLLEVARIACNRHSFSPAPGLVELEQEIDREIQTELIKMNESVNGGSTVALANGCPTVTTPSGNNKSMVEYYDRLVNGTRAVEDRGNNGKSSIVRRLWENDDIAESSLENVATNGQPNGEATIDGQREQADQLDSNHAQTPVDRENNDADEEEETTLVFNGLPAQVNGKEDSGNEYDGSNGSSMLGRSPSSNSVISSASSTSCLETNCGSSTTSSSTPTPMTSELDHKVCLLIN